MEYEELINALDGLSAYDQGCVDSGIHDEVLRKRCQDFLQSLPDKQHRTLVAKLTIDMFLSPESIDKGYGPEDALSFLKWLDEDMNCLLTRS